MATYLALVFWLILAGFLCTAFLETAYAQEPQPYTTLPANSTVLEPVYHDDIVHSRFINPTHVLSHPINQKPIFHAEVPEQLEHAHRTMAAHKTLLTDAF